MITTITLYLWNRKMIDSDQKRLEKIDAVLALFCLIASILTDIGIVEKVFF